MASSFLEFAVATGFKALMNKLIGAALERIGSSLKTSVKTLAADAEPHLAITFERCSQIKTILNRSHPVQILDIYENTRFKFGNESVDDYTLIENLHRHRNVIITGTGGGGKTIFMRYLWLSVFVNSQGRIPVFVELRRINEMSSTDLMTYVHRTIVDSRSKITREQFNDAVSSGLFLFIFDGFGEVNKEKRDAVGSQIRDIAQNNLELTVVVSGRPDHEFESWQSFRNFVVRPLAKEQVISLIKKLNYDEKIKKKFVQRIRKDLFRSHSSFLSNPLLATMMLLTFDQFAEIPEKTFIFYDQAFDTMFLKHDASKEGYQRKKYTNFSIDVFRKAFSFFCLFSYYDEKFEFSENDIAEYIKKSFRATSVKQSYENFLNDLIESICVMQRSGMEIEFTHRTFQEYFSAYCLANYIEDQFTEILKILASRPTDGVIPSPVRRDSVGIPEAANM